MDVSLAELHLHGLSHDVVVVPAFGIDPLALADPSGTHDIDLRIEATLPTIVLQKSPSHSQTLPNVLLTREGRLLARIWWSKGLYFSF